jgi:F-type H+-transporting ATPase subunit b
MALASSGGEHGDSGFNKTADFIYRIFNFVVLVGALFFLLRKPVGKAFAARTEGIREKLADLEQQKAEAEKMQAEYKEKLGLLQEETAKIVDSYIEAGEKAKAQIIEEAKKAADKMRENATAAIQHEFDRAKAEIQGEIVTESVAAAHKLIQAQIDTDDQNRLVDEYIAKVVVAQ